jgi:hypothetical protein
MSKTVLIIAQYLLAGLLFPAARSLEAQAAVLSGVVDDSTGRPIAGVEVTALRSRRVVRTDSAGRFSFPSLLPGALEIGFRRLAYEPAILQIQLPAGDTTDVEITLGLAARQLTAVLIEASSPQTPEMAAFETRRKQGIGRFITRSEIEHRHPMILSDLVRAIPGAILISGENGRTALRFSRTARNCPPQFYVDGIQVADFSIDDMPPRDVEGVELYPGAAGIPPAFNRMHSTSSCGTVLIWSHVPTGSRESGSSGKP